MKPGQQGAGWQAGARPTPATKASSTAAGLQPHPLGRGGKRRLGPQAWQRWPGFEIISDSPEA